MTSRVAVVTGANRGIGFEIVRGLLKLGEPDLRVILCSRDMARGKESISKLRKEFPTKSTLLTTEQLEISSPESVSEFTKVIAEKYKRLDILVCNAAFAYKASDPTPFHQQAEPTMKVNYFGTLNLTHSLLPLLLETQKKSKTEPKLIFVASQSGTYTFNGLSKEKQKAFSSAATTKTTTTTKTIKSVDEVNELVIDFISKVEKLGVKAESSLKEETGYFPSCYGMSKLSVITVSKILSKELKDKVFVASMCPGYCATDMSSWKGNRTAEKGAETAVWLALNEDNNKEIQTGKFWYDKVDISFV